MKKIIAILVILMLILTVFAACGRRKGNMVGTDSFPNLPNASSKVNSAGNGNGNGTGDGTGTSNDSSTSSKELTSSEIENAWGDASLDVEVGGGTSSSNTSSSGNSGGTSSSSNPGNTSKPGSVYDPNTSSNQGFKPYVPLI